jgi:hypothetical protein
VKYIIYKNVYKKILSLIISILLVNQFFLSICFASSNETISTSIKIAIKDFEDIIDKSENLENYIKNLTIKINLINFRNLKRIYKAYK